MRVMRKIIRAPTPPLDDTSSHIVEGVKQLQRAWQMRCSACYTLDETKACAGCGYLYYCSRECQQNDWESHREMCGARKIDATQMEPKAIWRERLERHFRLWTHKFDLNLLFAAYAAWKLRPEGEERNQSGLVIYMSPRKHESSVSRFVIDSVKSCTVEEMRSINAKLYDPWIRKDTRPKDEHGEPDSTCQPAFLIVNAPSDMGGTLQILKWIQLHDGLIEESGIPLHGDDWPVRLMREVEQDRPAMMMRFKEDEVLDHWFGVIKYIREKQEMKGELVELWESESE